MGGAALAWLPFRVSAADSVSLTVASTSAKEGEDGRGRSHKAKDPRALLVKADAGWPARALDPVLHVGDLHFHHYEHVDRTTLRFVVDDVTRLRVGAQVFVQYGSDERTRVRLPDLEKSW